FLEGAESAIYRIRNHPGLTFWCGGNEFDPDDKGSKIVIDSLGALLKQLDPQREFHRASPYMGDDHYWGVWHGQQPYTAYRVVRPFRSEAGINAPPVWENYKKFTPKDLVWPPDTVFIEYHGENNVNYMHVKKMLRYADEFGESPNMKELIMKSQLYQALANEFDLEFCRSNKFRNSGFLVWQYDDIWPCLSWSIVDWYGTPKASYYFMKRGARPVHISGDYERYLWKAGETFKGDIYLLNDEWEAVKKHSYKAKILDYKGNILAEKSGPANMEANSSVKVDQIDYSIPDSFSGKMFFFSVELFDKSGRKISDAMYPIAVSNDGNLENYKAIFAKMNEMPEVGLNVESATPGIKFDNSGNSTVHLKISNPGENLAYFVRTRMKEVPGSVRTEYSDNYISLLPGESKTITVKLTGADVKELPGEVDFVISGYNCAEQDLPVKVAAE
ncbi:MAG TPA: glycoside hydrolase family 2 protein, partial [Bacteroidales bacterium]|nr:glycoside hydrolase family 2 protein [Bacteroidales bacterium]